MKVKIFLNTDGYLGAWGTSKRIQKGAMIFDIPEKDIPIFHRSIDGRPGVKILPKNAKKFDAQFGDLKLSFTQDQEENLIKATKEAHKINQKKNALEEAIFT